MMFHEWDRQTMKLWSEDPQYQRLGQFYMNKLGEYNLELYRKVPEDIDPYYVTTRFPSFINWLAENWI
jgi:hypothetical protein